VDDESAAPPSELDFGGMFPSSLRVIPVRTRRVFFMSPQEINLAWRFMPLDADAINDQPEESGLKIPVTKGGWWIIGAGVDSVHALSAALQDASRATPIPTPSTPWTIAGFARPAALSRLIVVNDTRRTARSTLLRILDNIKRLHWRTLQVDNGAALLSVEVVLVSK